MNKLVIFLLFWLTITANIFAQSIEWETLRTDDGEFSMKMPASCYTHFYEPNGIRLPDKNGDFYYLKKMHIVTCFRDQTLLDVEIYESSEPRRAVKVLSSESGNSNKKIPINAEYVFARRFDAGKNHIYIITTATRGTIDPGEKNQMVKTFLESLKFARDGKSVSSDGSEKIVALSALKNFTPELIYETDQPTKPNSRVGSVKADPLLKKAVVLSLAKVSYTETARKKRVEGTIKLRLTLGANGRVNQFRVISKLPDGLLREAVIAALRTKFLPEEYDGKPRSSSELIEYRFGVY